MIFGTQKQIFTAAAIAVLMLIAGSLYSQDFCNMTTGPAVREVRCLTADSSGNVYAATWGNGLFRSTNSGQTFSTYGNLPANTYITSMMFRKPSQFFISTAGSGVFKSDNNGQTWDAISTGIDNLYIKCVIVGTDNFLYAGSYGSGVYRSTDNGMSWTNISKGMLYKDITCLIFADDTSLVAGTYGGGIWRLKKNKDAWERSSSGLINLFINGFVKNSAGQIYTATNGDGTNYSVDNGLSWSSIHDTTVTDLNATCLEINNDLEIFIGTRGAGLWYHDKRYMNQIVQVKDGYNYKNGITALVSLKNKVLIAAQPITGIIRSTDNGRTWAKIDFTESRRFTGIYGYKNGIIFAAYNTLGLYRSSDYGKSWNVVLPNNLVTCFGFDSVGNAYAGTSTGLGLYRSVDQGLTWTLAGFQNRIVLSISVDNLGNIYVFGKDSSHGNPPADLYKSTDNGISFQKVFTTNNVPVKFAINPKNNDGYILANKFYRATGNYQNWTAVNIDSSLIIHDLAFNSINYIFVATDKGIGRSTNNGQSWTYDDLGIDSLQYRSVDHIIVNTQDIVYAGVGSSRGLYYSANDGKDWDSLNANYFVSEYISGLGTDMEGDVFFAPLIINKAFNPKSMYVPNQAYPAPNIGQQSPNPTIKWTTVPKAELYQAEISYIEPNTLEHIVVEMVTQSDTTHDVVKPLDYSMTYYWRVRSKTNSAVSQWSQYRMFSTLIGPPQLISPANDSAGLPVMLLFYWDSIQVAKTYRLQISEDKDFKVNVKNFGGLKDTFYFLSTALKYHTKYYWRVTGSNSAGEGIFSDTWSFTTEVGLPILRFPDNNSIDLPTKLTFLWDTVESGTNYFIQISKSESFDPVLFESETDYLNKHLFTLLEYNTKYWWRIRAKNKDGYGEWTNGWNFTTSIEAPKQFRPEDSSVFLPLTITFSWTEFPGVDSYMIQVAEDHEFTKLVANDSGLTKLEDVVSGFANNKRYFWRIRSKIGERLSLWSDIRTFRTRIATPTLDFPANATDKLPINSFFVWKLVDGGVYYDIQVSPSQDFSSFFYAEDSIKFDRTEVDNMHYNTTYYWHVRAWNSEGITDWSDNWTVTTVVDESSVRIESSGIPVSIETYPNPFTDEITIQLKSSDPVDAKLTIIDGFGRICKSFTDGSHPMTNEYKWKPEGFAAGVYYLQYSIGKKTGAVPIVLVK